MQSADASDAGAAAPAERLLLWAMRSWVSLRMDGRRPQAWVNHALSTRASGRVAALFIAWMQALEAGRVRPLKMGCAGCGAMSSDEARLILACGIADSASRSSAQLLQPLVREPEEVTVLAGSLSAAMGAAGWPLPQRRDAAALELAGAPSTLH